MTLAKKVPVSLWNTKDMLASAAAVRRNGEEKMSVHHYVTGVSSGKVEVRKYVAWAQIQEWLDASVRGAEVSAAQGSFVQEVAERFYQEQIDEGRVGAGWSP